LQCQGSAMDLVDYVENKEANALLRALDLISIAGKHKESTGCSVNNAAAYAGISRSVLYIWCKKWDECKRLCIRYRLLKSEIFSPESMQSDVSIADIKADIFTPTKELLEKCDIDQICAYLKEGVPAKIAVGSVGLSWRDFCKLASREKEIKKRIGLAQAEWSQMYMKILMKAALEAAKKGKFKEIAVGAERRFPDEWGQINRTEFELNDKNGLDAFDGHENKGDTTHELIDQYKALMNEERTMEATLEVKSDDSGT